MALVRRPGDRRVGRGGRVVPRRAGRAVEAGHGPERGGGDRLVLVVLGFDAGNRTVWVLDHDVDETTVSRPVDRRRGRCLRVLRGPLSSCRHHPWPNEYTSRYTDQMVPAGTCANRTCSAASWHGMQSAPQLSRSVAGGRRARARSRSKMDLRRDVRGGEQQGHAAMAFDPGPCPGRNPAGHLQDALVVLEQSSREDRLVMGDPVAQLP